MASSNTPKPRDRQAWIQQSDPEVRIFYTECLPTSAKPKGTILLIHGFPESSYQFRHVMVPLAEAGHHVLAPDYRGHGYSSKPPSGYTKDVLAQDLFKLVTECLGIKEKIHIVGHDIGGMIAHAYVAQFSSHVASINWGECPLPGTTFYEEAKHTAALWHFDFQAQTDIAVALTTGKEKIYLKHFFDRLVQNQSAFTNNVLDFYATQYAAAGALNAAFTTYRMFGEDAKHNLAWREKNGKVRVRSCVMSGEHVFMTAKALEMAEEFYEKPEMIVIEGSGHFLAEENPDQFVKKVLEFVEKGRK
ncbi:hypothetical protein P7C71_g6003, partial [Lecanoromycetidae sp. Uapishka_2]